MVSCDMWCIESHHKYAIVEKTFTLRQLSIESHHKLHYRQLWNIFVISSAKMCSLMCNVCSHTKLKLNALFIHLLIMQSFSV